jgi:hypothetical protein
VRLALAAATVGVMAFAAIAPVQADDCKTNPLAKGCPPDRDDVRAKPPLAGHPEPVAVGADASLVHTAVTVIPRDKLSAFLVGIAGKAAKARDWAKAIPLHQALVAARGPGSPEAKTLATLWTLAGQNESAVEAWRAYAAATTGKDREHALAEVARLGASPDPFADRLKLTALTSEAKQAFALGRTAFTKTHYGDALVYFHIGLALAPDLPGFLRELGATYDKLGAAAQRRELYRRYLVQRPFGANADAVRGELAKTDLGTLSITSSLPCTELWVNRQQLAKPVSGIAVAPGSYKGLCFNPKYEMALFEYATVEAGKPAALAFTWAIIENKLEKPFGRIALENPKSPGTMIDLGITSTEIGVAAPTDGRKLKMILKDDAGLRTEERSVQIAPGQRLTVRW